MSARPRIRLPDNASIGEEIEIKTLIAHPMESGNRRNNDGSLVPRLLLHTFAAKFAGSEVFRAALHTGTAANPFISFFMKVPGPGEFEFTWVEDGGATTIERQALKVS
jgi:sulfur-oxidizing protein SoxZ